MVPVDYLMAYVTSAHPGDMQQWLADDMKQPPEKWHSFFAK
ncbi:TetR-like C-terminal domain-containing protein [Bacillus sp. J33]|nr:TetR-like C-terminal domain-containing protein [Bacillus sp. J33]